jgi:BirA family transcriptional regulator, biotin operon repressor / biotin---[acetyl-CoA-carboxylase] ligase
MAGMKKPPITLMNDYHLLSYDVLDSTNAEARRLAGGGASHGAVIWAKRQTDGRGRMGREWVSPEGNLYVSILLEVPKLSDSLTQLSFLAADAVAETLESMVDDAVDVRCKWPNDVLVNGKKLCGILLESFSTIDAYGKNRHWVVVGIGINIDYFPENVLFPATSMKALGVELVSAKIVLSRLIYNFIHHYDHWMKKGFTSVRTAWLKRAHMLGHRVQVQVANTAINGVFEGINETGAMLVHESGGRIQEILAGDVVYTP